MAAPAKGYCKPNTDTMSLIPDPSVISKFRVRYDVTDVVCNNAGQAFVRSDDCVIQLRDRAGSLLSTFDLDFCFYGMCVTANDEVLLTDEDKRCINSLSKDGHIRTLFSTAWKPFGACCIDNDEIIVSFRYDGRLVKYSSTGEIKQTFDSIEFRLADSSIQ